MYVELAVEFEVALGLPLPCFGPLTPYTDKYKFGPCLKFATERFNKLFQEYPITKLCLTMTSYKLEINYRTQGNNYTTGHGLFMISKQQKLRKSLATSQVCSPISLRASGFHDIAHVKFYTTIIN